MRYPFPPYVLRYRAPDLRPFLEQWPELCRGGEIALGPGEEARLQDLFSRQAAPAGPQGGGIPFFQAQLFHRRTRRTTHP